jgi:type VI secretion system secreted protein VgrG
MANAKPHVFELSTPLGKDVLLLRRMTGTEALGLPFELDLELLSEQGDLEAEKLLGQKVAIGLELPNGQKRHFHGFVTEFSQEGWAQRYHGYRATVRPWFWLLSRTADCRIFQELSVPQIFEKVVKDYGFTEYKLKLAATYPAREYCVQYRETDLAFLSRLLEEEGIYYFFEHSGSEHTLVLVDDPGQHETVSGYEKVPYYAPEESARRRERDHLESWTYSKSVRPGTFATTDFDFEKPRKPLAASESISRSHAQSHFEVFDYPADLSPLDSQQASSVARVRIQELQAAYMLARGQGNAAGLAAGRRFSLENYPRKDLNVEYLVTRATYSLASNAYESGESLSGPEFRVAIEAIEAKTHFRPERVTPKPVVQGSQTAMVVGKAGEEIYTDKYGRVKVQFHWDRYGKEDEKSSCWVRVAQAWAGKGWGGIHIPRVGQEVIVSFLEGDPDRPIITGRVYNGDSMPPYALPANATQSGIRSHSSKGGGESNFNEIRFEDAKGSEQLSVQAEKDHQILVKHDQTTRVDHDRTETVSNNESVSIGKDRSHKVGGDEALKVSGKRTVSIDQDDSAKIGKGLVIDAGESVTLKTGGASISMKSDGTITIKGADITIEGSGKVTVKASGNLVMKGSKILQN